MQKLWWNLVFGWLACVWSKVPFLLSAPAKSGCWPMQGPWAPADEARCDLAPFIWRWHGQACAAPGRSSMRGSRASVSPRTSARGCRGCCGAAGGGSGRGRASSDCSYCGGGGETAPVSCGEPRQHLPEKLLCPPSFLCGHGRPGAAPSPRGAAGGRGASPAFPPRPRSSARPGRRAAPRRLPAAGGDGRTD